MGSTRLPGKVLMDLEGEPMLSRVVTRAERAQRLDSVVVATSTAAVDDEIASLCETRSWSCFRGHESDVLDRFFRAAESYQADVVCRITADCPLIDPEVIDLLIDGILQDGSLDYVNNRLPPLSYPRGMEMDVVRMGCLKNAWEEDKDDRWREHVTPYIYNHPERFSIRTIRNDQDLSSHVWTVDLPEDLDFVRRIYAAMDDDAFLTGEILSLLQENPDWPAMNQGAALRSPPYVGLTT